MKNKLLAVIALAMLAGPMVASAVPMRLDAISGAAMNVSDFYILFDDTGDGLLDLAEVTFFSGIDVNVVGADRFYTILDRVPTIAGIANAGGSCFFADNYWCFSDAQEYQLAVPPTYWTYQLSQTSVPEPGTLALLGLGLLGLGFARRRKLN